MKVHEPQQELIDKEEEPDKEKEVQKKKKKIQVSIMELYLSNVGHNG